MKIHIVISFRRPKPRLSDPQIHGSYINRKDAIELMERLAKTIEDQNPLYHRETGDFDGDTYANYRVIREWSSGLYFTVAICETKLRGSALEALAQCAE